jgi:hypothetical protein
MKGLDIILTWGVYVIFFSGLSIWDEDRGLSGEASSFFITWNNGPLGLNLFPYVENFMCTCSNSSKYCFSMMSVLLVELMPADFVFKIAV